MKKSNRDLLAMTRRTASPTSAQSEIIAALTALQKESNRIAGIYGIQQLLN